MSKVFKIAAIAGDGIGKEVLPEGLRVLEQAAKKWQLDRASKCSTGRIAITTWNTGR